MLRQYAVVDGAKSFIPRKTDSKHTEVPLESRVDGKTASSGVHAGHILYIADLF